MPDIGQLNRKITLKSWAAVQDAGGGSSPVNVASYSKWAKVRARNGVPFTSEEQQVWNYDYEITTRYERSRISGSNYTIDFDGKRLRINSLSFENEGNRKWEVFRCTTIDANIDASNDVSILSSFGVFNYYGIGSESEFTSDSTVTPIGSAPAGVTIIPKDIRNRTILGAYKDGIEFNVILPPDVFDPIIKQVRYTAATGRFEWSLPYEPSEHTLIQYF